MLCFCAMNAKRVTPILNVSDVGAVPQIRRRCKRLCLVCEVGVAEVLGRKALGIKDDALMVDQLSPIDFG